MIKNIATFAIALSLVCIQTPVFAQYSGFGAPTSSSSAPQAATQESYDDFKNRIDKIDHDRKQKLQDQINEDMMKARQPLPQTIAPTPHAVENAPAEAPPSTVISQPPQPVPVQPYVPPSIHQPAPKRSTQLPSITSPTPRNPPAQQQPTSPQPQIYTGFGQPNQNQGGKSDSQNKPSLNIKY